MLHLPSVWAAVWRAELVSRGFWGEGFDILCGWMVR